MIKSLELWDSHLSHQSICVFSLFFIIHFRPFINHFIEEWGGQTVHKPQQLKMGVLFSRGFNVAFGNLQISSSSLPLYSDFKRFPSYKTDANSVSDFLATRASTDVRTTNENQTKYCTKFLLYLIPDQIISLFIKKILIENDLSSLPFPTFIFHPWVCSVFQSFSCLSNQLLNRYFMRPDMCFRTNSPLISFAHHFAMQMI